MSNVGFLLGAGASFPFGIPMMREFYDRFIDYVRTTRAHCMPLIEKIVGDDAANRDLEFLIQRLEQVRAIRYGLGVLGQPQDEVLVQLDLADELRGYLEMFLIETCERFDLGLVTSKLGRLVKVAHDRKALIFTTNYDRLIEVAASSAALNYCDGFEQPSSKPESKWNGRFEPGLALYKLHGSVNWYEEEGSDTLVRLERGYSLPSHEYRLTHGNRALRPLMIIPTLEKSVLRQPYVGLLTRFSDALKEISLLVVIGNSLRDDHLRNTITERAARLQLILINPAAEDQRSVVGHPESTHVVSCGIEELIDFGLDSFGTMLDALSPAMEIASRRCIVEGFVRELTAVAKTNRGLSAADRQSLERLRSESPEIVLSELRSIHGHTHAAVLTQVRDLALTAQDESVRVSAIDALADARGADAAEVFEKIACTHGPLSVRAEAVLALRAIDAAVAADAFKRTAELMANDRDIAPIIRRAQEVKTLPVAS